MKTVSILLIEDSQPQAELIRQLLSLDEQDYELVVRGTLEEGLERLSREAVDLVLLDLDLPDSKGEETFATVYAAAASMPVVILTGLNDEDLALRMVKQGAQDYLIKSQTDRITLSRTVRYAIERKMAHEELRKARDEMEDRVAERTEALLEANAALEKEVAERRRADNALRESNRQLGQALEKLRETQESVVQRERLHALGLMARGVAHHLNNSLSPVVGFSEVLLQNQDVLDDREKTLRYLQMIHTSALESARVVSRLDTFHRERDGEERLDRVNLAAVLDAAVDVTEYRWRSQALARGITIAIEKNYELRPTVSGSKAELVEAMSNLIINAADALEEDGTIELILREDLGQAVIVVRDNGCGMSETVRRQCLEPFFSTKGPGGSGLGLGLVYGIVSRHGGLIEIESAAERGTAVSIVLPKSETKEENPTVNMEPPPAPAPARILVVDDETLVREVLQVYLETDGHQVTMAEDGQQALEMFEAGSFDLVLTDRAMPEMNGDELAVAIKERRPDTPVILLTGFGDAMVAEGETLPGIDFILAKPFSTDSLRGALSRTLAPR